MLQHKEDHGIHMSGLNRPMGSPLLDNWVNKMKYKAKNTTLSEQFQTPIKK